MILGLIIAGDVAGFDSASFIASLSALLGSFQVTPTRILLNVEPASVRVVARISTSNAGSAARVITGLTAQDTSALSAALSVRVEAVEPLYAVPSNPRAPSTPPLQPSPPEPLQSSPSATPPLLPVGDAGEDEVGAQPTEPLSVPGAADDRLILILVIVIAVMAVVVAFLVWRLRRHVLKTRREADVTAVRIATTTATDTRQEVQAISHSSSAEASTAASCMGAEAVTTAAASAETTTAAAERRPTLANGCKSAAAAAEGATSILPTAPPLVLKTLARAGDGAEDLEAAGITMEQLMNAGLEGEASDEHTAISSPSIGGDGLAAAGDHEARELGRHIVSASGAAGEGDRPLRI